MLAVSLSNILTFSKIYLTLSFQQLLIISAVLGASWAAPKRPKIYNALITTDENLQPSKTFPLIQPVLQEQYTAFGPYGGPFGAYGGYDPFLYPYLPLPPPGYKPAGHDVS